MTKILTTNPHSITEGAAVLKAGGLVAMPTETVYGLAANALDGKAIARVFEAKGRPAFNPLIVHVLDLDAVRAIAEVTARDLTLASHFWPGPLTLILKRKENCGISDLVSAGLPTLAVRIPAHKTARALLKACGFPLAAPSANISGQISPTAPAHVAQSLGDKVDIVLADGVCQVGLESTVVDMSGDTVCILRPGIITAEDIERVLNEKVVYEGGGGDKPRSPGQTLRHYAPSIPLRLNAVDVEVGEALLAFGSTKFMSVRKKGGLDFLPSDSVRNLSEDGDLYEAAAHLFAMLRALDTPAHTAIAVMSIPDQGVGIAINDRLRRGANGL